MKFSLIGLAAAVTLSASALPAAAATTIDFDEFTHSGAARGLGRALTSGGFTFTTTATSSFSAWGATHANNADPGGAALSLWNGSSVTIARLDGQAFSLASIDLSDINNSTQAMDVMFTFFDGANTSTQLFSVDAVRGLETVSLARGNLVWFRMEGLASRAIQFDNMVWDTPITSAVPEPGAWALMITGFAGAGAALRRQRRAVRQTFA